MSFDNRKRDFDREHIYVVELDQKACSNTYGVPPCTASGSGDEKCYNTLTTCQDVPNYNETTQTYTFCEDRSPLPPELAAIPSLMRVNTTPSKMDLRGGLGQRSSMSLTFNDHPDADTLTDQYLADRTYNPNEVGTFWTKFRARNAFYENEDIRLLSGYLVNGSYDPANFETRYFAVSDLDASDGRATIKAKDPLAKVTEKTPLAPTASNGQLLAAITAGATSATLTPTGIGNAEYPASGKARIKGEVVSFTRAGDVLTLTRAQNNTVAVAHDANDTVQVCLEYSAQQVDEIIIDILTNYAEIDASLIDDVQMGQEVDTFLSGSLSTLIADPVKITDLLKELGLQMPHALYWDDKAQKIRLLAVKDRPQQANTVDMDSNLLSGTISTKDRKDLQISTVFVRFGQFDPTKRLDEINNYQQTYARVNVDAISRYKSNNTLEINSRWITNNNKAAALQLAALYGRRFGFTPREVKFSLDAKDSDFWIAQNVSVEHTDVVDFNGNPAPTIYQIVSAKEGDTYDYNAIEYQYDSANDEDQGGGDPDVDLVLLSIDENNIDLRAIYDSLFPAPDASTQARFVVEQGVTIGSDDNTTPAVETGSWPVGATLELFLQSGSYILGRGGNGGTTGLAALDGGDAINMSYDLDISNLGIIGGGGGGGANDTDANARGHGGGGAGRDAGNVGQNGTFTTVQILVNNQPDVGTRESGGDGGVLTYNDGVSFNTVTGGDGGDLGAAGGSGDGPGGSAGAAINLNGNTVTYIEEGDIRGSVS